MKRIASLIILIVFLGCVAPHVPPSPAPAPTPLPLPEPTPAPGPAPSTETVADLYRSARVLSAAQRGRLADFYSALAKAVSESELTATSALRAAHARSLKLLVSADSTFTNAPKIGDKIDAAIAEVMGLDDRNLDEQEKHKLVARLEEIGRVIRGARS